MNDNDNQNQPTTETQTQNPNVPAIKVTAKLSESEITALFIQMCRDRAIPISQPNPNLAEILEAVDQHVQAHRRRPIVEFPEGDKQWRSILNDLLAFHSSIEKILLHKISARRAAKTTTRPDQDPEAEQLQSAHATARAGEQPPRATRATAEQPPRATRATAEQSPRDPRSTAAQDASDPAPAPAHNHNFHEGDDLGDDGDVEDDELDEDEDDQKMRIARAKYLADLLRERSSRSPLDDLSPQRQKTLFELLQDHDHTLVAQMISQPSPLGWGVQTTRHSLRRFVDRYRKQNEKAELAQAAEDAEKIATDPNASPQSFTEATRRLIQMRLFQTASDPDSDAEDLQFLCRFLDRQRRTDLSERRVQIAEQKSNPQ